MHRFFLPPGRCGGTTVTLGPGDSHHAVRVLRLGPGAPVEVLDGAGRCLEGRVLSADRAGVVAVVDRIREVPAPPRVDLAPALLKGRAMDLLVQKATELGAASIRPLATARSVVQIGPREAAAKVEGWRSTAVEACKQCGNPWLPALEAPQSLEGFLGTHRPGLLLVASLRADARRPRAVLAGRTPPPPGGVTLVLGPEGDFTPEEETLLRAAGACPVSLGPLVLRAETAAIAGLALIQQELEALGGVGGAGVRERGSSIPGDSGAG